MFAGGEPMGGTNPMGTREFSINQLLKQFLSQARNGRRRTRSPTVWLCRTKKMHSKPKESAMLETYFFKKRCWIRFTTNLTEVKAMLGNMKSRNGCFKINDCFSFLHQRPPEFDECFSFSHLRPLEIYECFGFSHLRPFRPI